MAENKDNATQSNNEAVSDKEALEAQTQEVKETGTTDALKDGSSTDSAHSDNNDNTDSTKNSADSSVVYSSESADFSSTNSISVPDSVTSTIDSSHSSDSVHHDVSRPTEQEPCEDSIAEGGTAPEVSEGTEATGTPKTPESPESPKSPESPETTEKVEVSESTPSEANIVAPTPERESENNGSDSKGSDYSSFAHPTGYNHNVDEEGTKESTDPEVSFDDSAFERESENKGGHANEYSERDSLTYQPKGSPSNPYTEEDAFTRASQRAHGNNTFPPHDGNVNSDDNATNANTANTPYGNGNNTFGTPSGYGVHGNDVDSANGAEKTWRSWPTWLVDSRNQIMFSIVSIVLSLSFGVGFIPAAYHLFVLDDSHEKDGFAKALNIAAFIIPLLGFVLFFFFMLFLIAIG